MKLPPSLTTVTPFSKLIALFLVILFPLAGFYFGIKYQELATSSTPSSSYPSITPTTPSAGGPTADWKTYSNQELGFEFKYSFRSIQETKNSVSLGEPATNGDIFYLVIYTDPKTFSDYKSLKLCSQIATPQETPTICIDDYEGWEQNKPITQIKLAGVDAVSFYLLGDIDYAYHIVQTVKEPLIELKMDVSGGLLDDSFNQLLSTFKFLDSSELFVGSGCKISGCNKEICQNEADESKASICMYKPVFSCYATARCEKQNNGICKWTQTNELQTCLNRFPEN